jgi:hypothetical protein
VIYFIHEDEFIIRLNHWIEKSDFITAGRVMPHSYAEELLGRIYDCLFGHITNIVDEYNKYYFEEYLSLASFLFWKYSVDREIIAKVTKDLKPENLIGYGLLYSGGNYILGQFIMDESNLNMIKQIVQELV